MSHSEFVKEAVKRLPQAQDEFGELYATQRLEMKVGRAVMRSYKAAPRQVRSVYCFLFAGKFISSQQAAAVSSWVSRAVSDCP